MYAYVLKTFLREVTEAILRKEGALSNATLIVPNRRAGRYILNVVSDLCAERVTFAPSIVSMKEFVSEVSGLTLLSPTHTLFEFFTVYQSIESISTKDSFEKFSSWAFQVLKDFEEIDKQLIDTQKFFEYLSDIRELDHWSVDTQRTPLIEEYLLFWKSLGVLYHSFSKKMGAKQLAYEGLPYRWAVSQLDTYLQSFDSSHQFIFIGFNALYTSEQRIIQFFLDRKRGSIYWDADDYFIEQPYHNATEFIKRYQKQWQHLQQESVEWIQSHFRDKKNITILGTPRDVGQAKLAGDVLSKISPRDQNNTALILGDHALLLPILNSLPPTCEAINITMGIPLRTIPLHTLFESLFILHTHYTERGFYYGHLENVLNLQSIQRLLQSLGVRIQEYCIKNTLIHITAPQLFTQCAHIDEQYLSVVQLIFSPWKTVAQTIGACLKILLLIKEQLNEEEHVLEEEYIYKFYTLFNQIDIFCSRYGYIQSIEGVYELYKSILYQEEMDLYGEPFRGLQIMGLLESQCLDFENVIITSVNEGVLPRSKSNTSFIPYDLRKRYKLPTYQETDATYAYYFYRLLHRAKNIYLVYNTEAGNLNTGEKSRFLLQLLYDKSHGHTIVEETIMPYIPRVEEELASIPKNEVALAQLRTMFRKGTSATALTTYLRNPFQFYCRYVLKVKDRDQLEEQIAANTLGTIVHNVLETLYKPLEGQCVDPERLQEMQNKSEYIITKEFARTYSSSSVRKGINYLSYEVVKRHIYRFLRYEKQQIKDGHTIKIVAIEPKLTADIPKWNTTEMKFTGRVDRIDEYDGIVRIIDYKTGTVNQSKLSLKDWDELCKGVQYDKVLQLLTYAYMVLQAYPEISQVQAGIFSFRSLSKGVMPMSFSEKNSRTKEYCITRNHMELFVEQVQKLCDRILDTSEPFKEIETETSKW